MLNKEDITRRRKDMNFVFEWLKQYFMNERSEWVKYRFLPRENKINIFKLLCNFFLLYRQEYFCTNNSVKAGNDINDILTSEDMENTPLDPGCSFVWTLRVVYFPLKHSCLYNKHLHVVYLHLMLCTQNKRMLGNDPLLHPRGGSGFQKSVLSWNCTPKIMSCEN